MVNVLILLVMGMLALALLLMVVFGTRGLTYGKMSPMAMAATIAPIVLLIVLGMVMQDWPRAAIFTLIITLLVTAAALVLSSLKGLFS